MSWFFDGDVDSFTAGTVGPPGQRVFYLQAVTDLGPATLRLEKQQVAAMADHLARMLADLPAPGADQPRIDPAALELVEPVDAAWVVGTIGIGYDADADRVLVALEEVEDPEEAVEEGGETGEAEQGAAPAERGTAGAERGTARFRLTRAQVAAFVDRAQAAVEGGRPPCPLCGRPLDPEGHRCPRTNGHGPL